MQAIDQKLLAENRNKLVSWQNQQWNRNADGIRLHLGSGKVHLDKYINIDLYSDTADLKEDIRYLPSFKPNTVKEIVAHHVLEHLPLRDSYPTLKRFYEVLEPNGTIELGLPDFELSAQFFLESSENDKWKQNIYKIFGGQTEDPGFKMDGESEPTEYFEFQEGQVHRAGFSLGYFVRMVENIGFRMIRCFWYDAYGSPSFFVYAYKPEPPVYKSILEKDVALGVFTNKCLYLSNLWESVNKFLPQIPFFTRIQRGPINIGMKLLQEDFRKSKKRFHIYLDDDIAFINTDIIKNALEYLVSEKHGCVSVYSDFDNKCLITPYNPKERKLESRPHRWATGYFICVDNLRLSDVEPDLTNLWTQALVQKY
jgi:hypothetical protein